MLDLFYYLINHLVGKPSEPKQKEETYAFSESRTDELVKFFCGIGESEILDESIKTTDYPFEPSTVFPNKEIHFSEIDEIHLDEYPPTLKIGDELIFISREYIAELKEFTERNNIKEANRNSNWNRITEPFLDTEFDEEQKQKTIELLIENGFTEKEVADSRKEIADYMMEYNFGTMLWDWVSLGLNDVLSVMRVKLKKEEFQEFYWRAMEIEQRK